MKTSVIFTFYGEKFSLEEGVVILVMLQLIGEQIEQAYESGLDDGHNEGYLDGIDHCDGA